MHEGPLVRVYYVYNPDSTAVHVRHLRLSLRLFVRADCGLSVALIKRNRPTYLFIYLFMS